MITPLRLLALGQNLLYLKKNLHEATGHNDGPEIERILRHAKSEKGQPWCSALQWTSIDEVCARYGLANPLLHVPIPAQVQSVVNFAKDNDMIVSPEQAAVGDLIAFDFSKDDGRYDHIAMVFSPYSKSETFGTVEGNTNDAGSREGNKIAKKTRAYIPKKTVIIHWDQGLSHNGTLDEDMLNALKFFKIIN